MTVISIDGHPREEELAAYVDDTLALPEVERLEAHVFACSVCARRLQRAASLQVLMHEAAASLEVAAAPVRSPSWLRRHLGAVTASWASAAAVLLMVGWPPGGSVAVETDAPSSAAVATAHDASRPDGSATRCDPADPRCADGLLASVDPLQSVDPLSSWPDDPFFASAGWADDAAAEGEPCGSGEDGGPLVCKPFSG